MCRHGASLRRVGIEDIATTAAARQLPPPSERRRIRKQARVSQEELAAGVGVQRPTVTRWESGTREPRGRLAERYSSALRRLAEVALENAESAVIDRAPRRKAVQPARDGS